MIEAIHGDEQHKDMNRIESKELIELIELEGHESHRNERIDRIRRTLIV